MMISRRIITGVTVMMATIVAVLGSAPASYAATSNIVSTAGNTTTGTASVQVNPTGTLTLTSSAGAVLTCATPSASQLTGTANRGANASGTLATFPTTGVKFGTASYSGAVSGGGSITPGSAPCTGAGGTIAVAAKSCSTWAVQTIAASGSGTHPPSAPVSGQVTPVQVANICTDVYVGSTNSCHFRVTGLVTGTYTNNASNAALTIDPTKPSTLTVSQTSNPTTGCIGGAIKDGQTFRFGGANSSTSSICIIVIIVTADNPMWVNA